MVAAPLQARGRLRTHNADDRRARYGQARDKTDRPINPHCGPLDYEAGWLKIQGKGADGLYLFNNPKGWATLRRMGHLDEVRKRVETGQVHALIEGPVIEFAK